MWLHSIISSKSQEHFLASGGTWNYGIWSWCACIGAKVGRKDKTVVNIAGDGMLPYEYE
ncbi:MAG: thiamine pyrophosphate-dependent enzyme [Lachnospira eligens]